MKKIMAAIVERGTQNTRKIAIDKYLHFEYNTFIRFGDIL
jgi:hypothetical protein